jgi:hypothetical protein
MLLSNAATWIKAGESPRRYSWSFDPSVRDHGAPTMALAADDHDPMVLAREIVARSVPSATAYAVTAAKPFANKRIRLRASIRTEGTTLAWLWMRIDDATQSILCIGANEATEGTHDFTPLSCVLEVPSTASTLVFGIELDGAGRAWIGTATIDEVTRAVPETHPSIAPRQFETRPTEPMVTALAEDVRDRCWTRAGPPADVHVDLRLIVEDGHALSTTASSNDPAVNRCVESLAMNWLLPIQATTTLTVPFHFVRH